MSTNMLVKNPTVRGGLALFPVFGSAPSSAPYATGPEADAAGTLSIEERPIATVSELVVHNASTWPVLLLEGETLLGAWQNRTLNVSVLVNSRATLTVPVSCVEAGRWHDRGAMGRSGRHAPSDLRRVKSATVNAARLRGERAHSDQRAVWARIDDYQHELAMATPTGALDDVYGGVRADVDAIVRDLEPHPDQRGVIVAVGGELRGLDVFDKPSTLASYWESLVTGYAIDALRAPEGAAPSTADAERFLARLEAATDTPIPAVGLGVGHALTGDGIEGQALEWEGANVHLAAFATRPIG